MKVLLTSIEFLSATATAATTYFARASAGAA